MLVADVIATPSFGKKLKKFKKPIDKLKKICYNKGTK
jgi:hypothetical protein